MSPKPYRLRFDNQDFTGARAADEARAIAQQRGDLDPETVTLVAEWLLDCLPDGAKPSDAASALMEWANKQPEGMLHFRSVLALRAHFASIDQGQIISAIVRQEQTPDFVAFCQVDLPPITFVNR